MLGLWGHCKDTAWQEMRQKFRKTQMGNGGEGVSIKGRETYIQL